MDSDRPSSALPAGKIRSCQCERRIISRKFDFHTVCIQCVGVGGGGGGGVDCDIDIRCSECNDVTDITMTEYVKHKLSLKKKLLSKRKPKDPLLSSAVADDFALVAEDPSCRTGFAKYSARVIRSSWYRCRC